MRGNRGYDTGPEMALRRALHSMGLRYRVNTRPLSEVRRTADVVFTRARVAVFLDGCFWHGCPEHYRPVQGRNSEYWRSKIARNQERDRETDRLLEQAGWTVVRVWEHEDPVENAKRIETLVRRD
ncbi:T/G mismatch-specific endonuclease [Haloactinospora alba]|uniref:T/G mismatch-specific endonuclease n=2 Tax=Haloactinospora alba TaxID=405555 RepID=A0A543N9X5_9ACTN|nr:T/G mismatch-specific endonuclease [Haloactinospora alba]